MKNVMMKKIQPAEVRGYTVCPEVHALVKKMRWSDFRPAGYLLALERLEEEGNFTPHLDNILLTLSDISPTLTSAKPTVQNVMEKAQIAGTIRKAGTTLNGTQQYALTTFGREIVTEIRAAVIAFAEWERKLPTGRYNPSRAITKNQEIQALTKENEKLNVINDEQARVIRAQDVRIYELEMLVASLTRRP